MKYLLHTKVGNTKTLEFIDSTKLATRSWHLNRTQEEEEEVGGEGEEGDGEAEREV
ncbi:hypothetical protein OCU04_008655 [Sclerotinia nivalis]|uniref:Uncharacterized protein n=1 Tax=Sclerotinia nivalis TaxID=352851 RepID=A0A9X0DJ17_9HELO|nr:hypothetical protein OCU04_008655 [Sclerotinia nivalis]